MGPAACQHASHLDRDGHRFAAGHQRSGVARGDRRRLPAAVAPAQSACPGGAQSQRRDRHLPWSSDRRPHLRDRDRRQCRGRQEHLRPRVAGADGALARPPRSRPRDDRRLPLSPARAAGEAADVAQGLSRKLRHQAHGAVPGRREGRPRRGPRAGLFASGLRHRGGPVADGTASGRPDLRRSCRISSTSRSTSTLKRRTSKPGTWSASCCCSAPCSSSRPRTFTTSRTSAPRKRVPPVDASGPRSTD